MVLFCEIVYVLHHSLTVSGRPGAGCHGLLSSFEAFWGDIGQRRVKTFERQGTGYGELQEDQQGSSNFDESQNHLAGSLIHRMLGSNPEFVIQ
jgi:hypothetical protein